MGNRLYDMIQHGAVGQQVFHRRNFEGQIFRFAHIVGIRNRITGDKTAVVCTYGIKIFRTVCYIRIFKFVNNTGVVTQKTMRGNPIITFNIIDQIILRDGFPVVRFGLLIVHGFAPGFTVIGTFVNAKAFKILVPCDNILIINGNGIPI